MKIGELRMHCGNCSIVDYCGNPYGYRICGQERFSDMDDSEYRRIAETLTDIKTFPDCKGCERSSCEAYRFSENDYDDDDCENRDERLDFYCAQVADYVYSVMIGKESEHNE